MLHTLEKSKKILKEQQILDTVIKKGPTILFVCYLHFQITILSVYYEQVIYIRNMQAGKKVHSTIQAY